MIFLNKNKNWNIEKNGLPEKCYYYYYFNVIDVTDDQEWSN